jgi:hypothetical protein
LRYHSLGEVLPPDKSASAHQQGKKHRHDRENARRQRIEQKVYASARFLAEPRNSAQRAYPASSIAKEVELVAAIDRGV